MNMCILNFFLHITYTLYLLPLCLCFGHLYLDPLLLAVDKVQKQINNKIYSLFISTVYLIFMSVLSQLFYCFIYFLEL